MSENWPAVNWRVYASRNRKYGPVRRHHRHSGRTQDRHLLLANDLSTRAILRGAGASGCIPAPRPSLVRQLGRNEKCDSVGSEYAHCFFMFFLAVAVATTPHSRDTRLSFGAFHLRTRLLVSSLMLQFLSYQRRSVGRAQLDQ